MKLTKVEKKKCWTYEYDDSEEMEFHKRTMTGFNIESEDKENLIIEYSQIIFEAESDENVQKITLSSTEKSM